MAASVSDSINQRFLLLIQQLGLTKNSFAISLGKTASVIQHLIDGRNKPGYDLLCKVFEVYPNVSRDWLLLGRGPMLVSGEAAPELAATPVAVAAPELPLTSSAYEPIEVPPLRRPSSNSADFRLQPADIAATLALAAATTQPARTVAPAEKPVATELPQAPIAPAPPATVVAPAPQTDTGLATILHTQHLQHQLALAELRNQHLLEQQQMLREMLEMARR